SSYALGNGAARAWIYQQGGIRVTVDVDEPRRNDQAGNVQRLRCLESVEMPDSDDAPIHYGHIGIAQRLAGSIYQRAPAERHIDHFALRNSAVAASSRRH